VSDSCAAGERDDTSGDRIVAWAGNRGFEVVARAVVPDESDEIARHLIEWSDNGRVDLVLTTGGTGLSRRDVTPEATLAVVERPVPGIAEAMRFAAYEKFPRSVLSRGVAGSRGGTLIVNLPGSPGGVKDGLAVLDSVVQHAVDILSDHPTDH
jgi:molybdenum cofactor synthesis domain-containing protein